MAVSKRNRNAVIRFTAGWYRSFEIASLAEKYGGRPYAVALWNARHAEMYYSKETYETLLAMKKAVDPKRVLNPMKVFGGRVQAAGKSLVFGFIVGFVLALGLAILGPNILGLLWLQDFMNAILLSFLPMPNFILISVFGGVVGVLFIKLMSLNQALALGIPILKVLGRLL